MSTFLFYYFKLSLHCILQVNYALLCHYIYLIITLQFTCSIRATLILFKIIFLLTYLKNIFFDNEIIKVQYLIIFLQVNKHLITLYVTFSVRSLFIFIIIHIFHFYQSNFNMKCPECEK